MGRVWQVHICKLVTFPHHRESSKDRDQWEVKRFGAWVRENGLDKDSLSLPFSPVWVSTVRLWCGLNPFILILLEPESMLTLTLPLGTDPSRCSQCLGNSEQRWFLARWETRVYGQLRFSPFLENCWMYSPFTQHPAGPILCRGVLLCFIYFFNF